MWHSLHQQIHTYPPTTNTLKIWEIDSGILVHTFETPGRINEFHFDESLLLTEFAV